MDLTRSQSARLSHAQSLSPALKVEFAGANLSAVIERTTPHCTALLDFDAPQFFNQICFESALHVLAGVSWSNDGLRFFRVHGLRHESQGELRLFEFPLVEAKCLQLHFYQEAGPIHRTELKKLVVGFHTKATIKATSTADRLWTAENLLDRRDDYGWASGMHTQNKPDVVDLDLGKLYFVCEIRIKSIAGEFNAIPVGFNIQISEDAAIWQTIQSEDHFFAAPLVWYSWVFAAKRARYVRLQIDKHAHYKKEEYQSKILDLAVIGEADAKHNFAGDTVVLAQRLASENTPGVVLLAGNNISAPSRVVQSDDSRLRTASTEYKGIVQFARDGETAHEKAVQGDDSRLKLANELAPGVVQLAKDSENRAGSVVQGNDSRLKIATAEIPGIAQLARDGDTRAGVVVQGNDSRIKNATPETSGIVQLAHDGEALSGKVIQGNDSRLRSGTQAWPGIVQLANHGEIASAKAVAADDSRLLEGDEARKGRVQFARKNEVADLKAVQASDPRLQNASTDMRGIVQFARDGVAAAEQAVEANDLRLSDARAPKPHVHSEYAANEHPLSAHSGNLHLKRAQKTTKPDGIAMIADINLPLHVENSEGFAANFSGGLVAQATETAGHFLSKSGPAIYGAALDASAAALISARGYALHLPRSVAGLKGSEKAIHAEGLVQVDGQLNIKGGAAISIALPKASSEAFVDGDILTIDGGVAAKMRSENQYFIGVAVKSAALQLESVTAAVRVAVAGLVTLRVCGVTKAGDRLVLNSAQPGTCKVEQGGAGKVLAIALEPASSEKEKPVMAILVR